MCEKYIGRRKGKWVCECCCVCWKLWRENKDMWPYPK